MKAWVEAEEAAPKRWELLLRETRGEPEKDPAIRRLFIGADHRRVHRLILTEKVLEVLAENGRNLRHLTPEERVTIAFTFRTPTREEREAERRTLLRHYFPQASSEGASGMMGAFGGGMAAGAGGVNSDGGLVGEIASNKQIAGKKTEGGTKMIGGRPTGGGGARTTGNQGGGAVLPPGSGPAGAVDDSRLVSTSAVAGDLLLRQERYVEAIIVYEKALKESGIDLADDKKVLAADAADMVRKLVQAHVGAKNVARATALLQRLERSQASSSDETTALRRIYLDLIGIPPTADEVKAYLVDTRPNRRELLLERLLADRQDDDGPSRVPARMTISCTRKQLEEVAAGKLSKLDFANQATLKYYKATPAAKKAASARN